MYRRYVKQLRRDRHTCQTEATVARPQDARQVHRERRRHPSAVPHGRERLPLAERNLQLDAHALERSRREATIDQLSGQRLDEVSGFKEEALPAFSDQILPFDITLAGTNEIGAATCMKIYGVEILNEGSGVSIDDAVTEMQGTLRNSLFVKPCRS